MRGCRVTLQQADLPATLRQALRRGATGQPGTDHQRLALAGKRSGTGEPGLGGRHRCDALWPGDKSAAQHFPFMPDARHPLHLETRRIQRTPHPAGAGEGANGGTRCGQSRQFSEQLGCPHFRIFRWCKPVEKPRVNLPVQLRQHLQRIADQQRQGHTTVIEYQALKAFMYRHVLLEQWIGET